jgi:hypothetical protein
MDEKININITSSGKYSLKFCVYFYVYFKRGDILDTSNYGSYKFIKFFFLYVLPSHVGFNRKFVKIYIKYLYFFYLRNLNLF